MAIMWHNSFIFGPNFNNHHHHQMEKEILAGCLEQPVVVAVQSQLLVVHFNTALQNKLDSVRFGTVWAYSGSGLPETMHLRMKGPFFKKSTIMEPVSQSQT